jgi:hypothetical protein
MASLEKLVWLDIGNTLKWRIEKSGGRTIVGRRGSFYKLSQLAFYNLIRLGDIPHSAYKATRL